MKRNVTVTATDGDTTVELTGKISSASYMTRYDTERIADTLRDELMQVLPGLPCTNFRLSKVKVS